MPPSIHQLAAKEIVPYVPNYKVYAEGQDAELIGFTLLPGEIPAGRYCNIPGELEQSLLLTSRGIHIVQDSLDMFIDYDQMDSVDAAADKFVMVKNRSMRQLVLLLQSGESARIPVLGENKSDNALQLTLHLYSFWGFFRKAIFWSKKKRGLNPSSV